MRASLWRRSRYIYLDANATTAVSESVRRQMLAVLERHPGNPSAMHRAGRDAAAILAAARMQVATTINAVAGEIIFTSGATEANNAVLRALAAQATPARNRLLTSAAEHSSVRAVAESLAMQGIDVAWLPVDQHGRVNPARLAAMLDERVFLVSCMLANNELGTINPVAELARLAHKAGARFHSDCVQALGKIPVDMQLLGVDYASFSAHKLHGPKGTGVLYARASAPAISFMRGGGQERGLRAGTEATHDIAGCGAAFAAVPDLLARSAGVARCRDRLLALLRQVKPDLRVNSPVDEVTGNTLNVQFPGIRNHELLAFLDANGIAVSAGSACAARGGGASQALLAIGLDEDAAKESLRFSLGIDISEDDVDFVGKRIAAYLRGEAPPVTWLMPSDIDQRWLDDPDNFILDVRFGVERRLMRGLPGAHEIPFSGFARHFGEIPRDRNVLVVCSSGIDASFVAHALKARGYPRVCLLLGGVLAWRQLSDVKKGSE